MDSGPPLNLSTSVKVEDSNITNDDDEEELGITSELVKHSDGNQTYVLLQPAADGSESITITGEAIPDDEPVEDSKTVIDSNEILENKKLKNGVIGIRNRSYTCSHCSETFHRATQLRTHEKTHVEDKVHECDQCPEIFSRLSYLVEHKQEHVKKTYSCTECNILLFSFPSFRLHMKKHKIDKKFKCVQCSMSFTQHSHLITHVRKHTGEKPYTCPMCNTKFKQISHLTTHLRVHTNDRPYVCDICNAAFSQTGSLKRHKRSHTGEKPFKCDKCNAVFVEKRNLNRHLLSHSGIRPFKCDLCSASFTQLIDLKRHKLSHSGIKPYKCDICEASFSRKNNLKWHKLTHEGNTPHICEICNVGFRIARDLKSHKRTHIENKPYTCEQCKACFAQLTTLKRHVLVHSGHKPFSCPKCDATFFERSALKRHVHRHGNVRPYSCELCLTSFIEARALKRHKIVVHNEGKYEDPSAIESVIEESIGEISVSRGIIKNSSGYVEEENSLHIYEPIFQKPPKIEENKNSNDEIEIPPTQSTNSEIFFNELSPQSTSQQPTLVLTQPGQPPKTGRPANSCQNHNSHVHTLLEGSYNQWQTWCFCDHPSIPSQSESLAISNSNSQSLTFSSGMQPIIAQNHPQVVEFQTQDLSKSGQHQQQEILSSQVNHNPMHNVSPSLGLSGNVTKCQLVSQIHDSTAQESTSIPISQTEIQSTNAFQHYGDNVNYANEHVNYSNDMPVLNNCHNNNLNPQENMDNIQKDCLQGSKSSYIEIPNRDLSTHVYQSQTLNTNLKKHSFYDKDQAKFSKDIHRKSNCRSSALPVISRVGTLRENLPHESVIVVANESSKLIDPPNNQISEQACFTGNHSQIVSTNSDQSIYKEFLPDKEYHRNNIDQNVQQDHDNVRLQCVPMLSLNETENQIYEPLPDTHSQDNKNQINLQYSLTVNNPATGEIQIQSDVFSAKTTIPSDSKPPLKKRKAVRNSVIQEKKLNCTYCPKSFVKPGPLEMHIRIHTGEKPFICGICNQHFSHNNSLTIHMRSHTGERPYTCIYCGATFTQKSNLRVHHRTHTGEKPFKCSICDASFSQGSHLKAHIRIHNNDRPFVCAVCGQAFTQRSALKRHQMKHTGIKPHACGECDAKFSQKDDLKRHMSNHNNQIQKLKQVMNVKKKKSLSPVKQSDSLKEPISIKNKKVLAVSVSEVPVPVTETQSEVDFKVTSVKSVTSSAVKNEASGISQSGEEKLQASIHTEIDPLNLVENNSVKEVMKIEINEKNRSSKILKAKQKSMLVEPSRTSRRIKEAAERKKFKPEDSDFITGDLEEIDIAEELENTIIKSSLPKVSKKREGLNKKVHSEEGVQSWCFCEVPHGPDEPHTHLEAPKADKKFNEVKSAANNVTNNNSVVTNLDDNGDYIDGGLQFGLQQLSNAVIMQSEQISMQGEHNSTQLSENIVLNPANSTSEIHIVDPQEGCINTTDSNSIGQLITSQQVHANHLPVVESEDGKTIYATAQIISAAQVLSGGQFIAPEGTFFIEAGDLINSNGTVVLNSTSPGTFYFDLGAEGQFVNVPVSVGTPIIHETQVMVPGTIVEESGNVYSSTGQSVSIHPNTLNFSEHVDTTLLDGSQRTIPVLSSSINNIHGSVERGEGSSHLESLHYTSLDNNEITLLYPNADLHQTSSDIVVKDTKSKKVRKSKSVLPVVVNPCKCSVCGKVFAQKVTLRAHMDEAHRGLQYCLVCFDAFTSREHLNTHKLQHLTAFECSECSQTFAAKNALFQHRQKVHNAGKSIDAKKEQRSFECNQCDSRFYQRSDLKRHNLGHTGEKPFKCWQCGAGFTRKYSLKKHERIHTGEKPYNCRDCEVSFAYRHQYNRHLSTHAFVEETNNDAPRFSIVT